MRSIRQWSIVIIFSLMVSVLHADMKPPTLMAWAAASTPMALNPLASIDEIGAFQKDGASNAGAGGQPGPRAGKYEGVVEEGIRVFRGIPYAQPPVGNWRWQPPRPASKPQNIRSAKAYGPVCPQDPEWIAVRGFPQDENCLTLNVWTVDVKPEKPLPVMVWIHGGSFKGGSNRWRKTEGHDLARQGTVLVSINYRLGYLGRFAHPALSTEQARAPLANYGIMDQIEALKWVQDNIADFGGDPDNVTIFGYSAGAVSVNFLMTIPSARGLFHKAIAQSSAVSIPLSRNLRNQVGMTPSLESEGVRVVEQLGLAESKDVMAELRALPPSEILTVGTPPGSMNPIVDGVLVIEDLVDSFRSGRVADIPYLAGVNSWEASLADSLHRIPLPALKNMFLGVHGLDAGLVDAVYDMQQPTYGKLDKLFADGFHASTAYLAKLRSRYNDSYLYLFDYMPAGAAEDIPGVPHGAEVPYVFNQLEYRNRVGSPAVTDSDQKVASLLQAYWVKFAKTGNPNATGLPSWPKLRGGEIPWMRLNASPSVEYDWLADRIGVWEERYERENTP